MWDSPHILDHLRVIVGCHVSKMFAYNILVLLSPWIFVVLAMFFYRI